MPFRSRRLAVLLLLIGVSAFGLAGCGGGGDDESTDDDAPAGDTSTDEADADEAGEDADVTTSEAGAPAAATAAPDSCTLITPEDIKTTFGVDAEAGVLGPNNTCEYGSTSSDLTIDGVDASLRVSADLMTAHPKNFESAYVGSGGYEAGDAAALKGLGVVAYSRLGEVDESGLSSGVASSTVLTAGGVTVNVELGVVNSRDQTKLRSPAAKTKLEALTRTAVGRVG